MNARTRILRWAVPSALAAVVLALVGVLALHQTALAQEEDDSQAPTSEPDGLFYEVEGEPPPSIGVDTLESRLVGIDFGQLAQVVGAPVSPKDPVTGKPTRPRTLVLNMFDDVEFTGLVEHIEPTASGHALWGGLEGVELGTMALVVNGSVVVGTVRTPYAVYSIRTGGDGTYVIRQIDESSLPPLGEPLEDALPPRDSTAESDDVSQDDGSVIDVMVVYTPLAKLREGGRTAIEALIDLFVVETNQAYANSGVVHRIRLVLRDEVAYKEAVKFLEVGNSGIDLGRLRDDSDGYMDHVHKKRNQYAADLVHLVVGRGNVCGLATTVGGDESQGFALTVSGCGGLVFAHELGHNMGLHHDRYVVEYPGRRSNYGYVNQRMFEPDAPESAHWRTIMAYSDQCSEVGDFSCPRVQYFSNPEKTHNGDPMGVPVDHPSTGVDGPADAVGTLNNRREITANFRRASTSPTPRMGLALSPYWLSENGGVSTVTAMLHRPSSVDTVVTVSASPDDGIILSGNGTLTIPAGETVSVDNVTITGVDNSDQTGDVSVTVSATAANPSSAGVIAPEPVELSIADDETTPMVTLSLLLSKVYEGGGLRDGRRTLVSATLDNRSSAETIVTVSASPAEAVEVIGDRGESTLTIPAGQSASDRYVIIDAVDDTEFVEAKKIVTVSGTATNPQGVAGPESVTLTIIDDDAPIFADDSISYTFTAGVPASRVLPEAEYGNEPLTYSLSPAPSNGVTFVPGPPARIGVSETSIAAGETSYTLTATDAEGDTDTMTVNITVFEGVCPNSASVSGYSDLGIVADCEALLASRDALRGDQSLNWSKDLSIDNWEGVKIAHDRVVGIDMSSLGLSGTIPGELGSLAKLESLRLHLNKLTGPIPAELGGLSNLQSLNTSYNPLTGEIPVELGNLSNLQSLDLVWNELTGEIPAELGNLSNLQSLGLSENELTGPIPAELGGLSNLIRLDLGFNQLTGDIPTELADLNNLRELSLGENQLTGEIPAELGDLSNLEELYLYQNEFTGVIPVELGGLNNLKSLQLTWNQFTGPIPAQLGDLINLRELSLGENQLTGEIPSELGVLSNLRELSLGWNELTGPIPTELGGLVNLQSLSLGGNELSGEIPSELGALSNLRELYLSHNQLTGNIPRKLGSLSNLQWLSLSGNQLTGCVPAGLRDVPQNDFVQLGLPFCENEQSVCATGSAVPDAANNPGLVSDCEALLEARDTLAGTATLNWSADTPIADWDGITLEGAPQRVTVLTLPNRKLTGELPLDLGRLADLEDLHLHGNQLTGAIPAEFGNLNSLKQFTIEENRLSGSLPQSLIGLTALEVFHFLTNAGVCAPVDDAFQAWLDSLRNVRGSSCASSDSQADRAVLVEFYESMGGRNWTNSANWLSDRPLREWYGVTNDASGRVSGLYFFRNQVTGSIPSNLEDLIGLKYLDLHENQVSGAIPAGLGKLSNLEVLDLRSNRLTGSIPTELGELANLQRVILAVNQLSGTIPTELGRLANLEELSLAGNRLGGTIPAEFGNLANLQFLRLQSNQLTGDIPSELGNLTNLKSLYLGGNQLTGCVPAGLRDVPQNDFVQLGLPFCENEQSVCATGSAVPDAANNPGLVSDCEALLEARDTLAGTATLNWSADTPIADWDGIILEGAPQRVTRLGLFRRGLTGEIPEELASLTNLDYLSLSRNQLTGEIPPELGSLINLERLYVSDNNLTGTLPSDFTRLTSLEHLAFLNNAGLCAPISDAFQTWLQSLRLLRGSSCAPVDSPEDRATLIELYGVMDGANWTNNTSWLSERPLREWYGVTNDREGRVNGLILTSNQLSGEIPAALSSLANLQQVYLTGNQLTGEIPAELGGLVNLQSLSLGGNELSGEIPSELGALSNLRELYLPRNQLTGEIPSELSSLANLEVLSLLGNQLIGEIPTELSRLANLEGLYLYNNQLIGEIPVELAGLSKLRVLYLHSNQLAGQIPAELGGLTNLQWLRLDGNQLTGAIPVELGRLVNLERLYLSGNQLTGCVPVGLRDVPQNDLVQLDLPFCESDCETGVAVPDAANNPGLVSDCEALLAAEDTLVGSASLNWAADTPIAQWEGVSLGGTPQRVTRLVLPGKGLGGTIPPELGSLSMLTDLNLRSNALTGEIPEELGSLTNLRVLNLHSNKLSGDIPDLSSITGLKELYLPNNYDETVEGSGLTGPVPTWLNGMTNMRELWLWGNQLSGTIPDLSGMTSLQKLKLANNMLTGGVPDGSMLPPNMTWLIIDRNPLGGSLPDLSELTSLRLLWLHSNGLTGSIPAGDMLPPNVDDLNLRDNMLTGEIPDLSGLHKATRVRLHNNDLTGEIPATLGDLDSLQSLWLHGNMLTGSIPTELGSLTNLQRLWLSDNKLSGQIPEELGELSNHSLVQWRLSGNQFSGCVPVGLTAVNDNDFSNLGLQICSSPLSEIIPWWDNLPWNAPHHDAVEAITNIWAQEVELGEAVAGLSWVVDGITHTEAGTLYWLDRLTSVNPDFTRQMLRYPWVSREITEYPSITINMLSRLGIGNAELAQRIGTLPWLADAEEVDLGFEFWALVDLAQIARFGGPLLEQVLDRLHDRRQLSRSERNLLEVLAGMTFAEPEAVQELVAQPWFTDGLDDEEAAFLITLQAFFLISPELYTQMTENRYTQSARVSLPLSGEVTLWAFQNVPFSDDDDLLAVMEDALRTTEGIMAAPFPTTEIIVASVVASKSDTSYNIRIGTGAHTNGHIVISRYESASIENAVAVHQTAHFYFQAYLGWFSEGGSQLIAAYMRNREGIESYNDRLQILEAQLEEDCLTISVTNLHELGGTHGGLGIISSEEDPRFRCVETMGEHFYLSLLEILGEQAVLSSLRELDQSFDYGLNDRTIYQRFLNNVPPGKEGEFHDLFSRLHGGPFADFDPTIDLPDDHGDSVSGATGIAVGEVVEGTYDHELDIDYFRFSAEKGRTYHFTVEHVTVPFSEKRRVGEDNAGNRFTVYASDGETMVYRSPYDLLWTKYTRGSQVEWTPPNSGEYYLAIENHEGLTGTYTLSITEYVNGQDDHSDEGTDAATEFSVGDVVSGELNHKQDLDYFRIRVKTGREYVAFVVQETLGWANVWRYKSDGLTPRGTFRFGWTAWANWTEPASDESHAITYLTVFSDKGHVGTYSLTVFELDGKSDDQRWNVLEDIGASTKCSSHLELVDRYKGWLASQTNVFPGYEDDILERRFCSGPTTLGEFKVRIQR